MRDIVLRVTKVLFAKLIYYLQACMICGFFMSAYVLYFFHPQFKSILVYKYSYVGVYPVYEYYLPLAAMVSTSPEIFYYGMLGAFLMIIVAMPVLFAMDLIRLSVYRKNAVLRPVSASDAVFLIAVFIGLAMKFSLYEQPIILFTVVISALAVTYMARQSKHFYEVTIAGVNIMSCYATAVCCISLSLIIFFPVMVVVSFVSDMPTLGIMILQYIVVLYCIALVSPIFVFITAVRGLNIRYPRACMAFMIFIFSYLPYCGYYPYGHNSSHAYPYIYPDIFSGGSDYAVAACGILMGAIAGSLSCYIQPLLDRKIREGAM